MTTPKINENAAAQDLVDAYNRAESERVGYPFASQWVLASDDSLVSAVGDLVATAEARGYRKAIEALRDSKRYDEWYSVELPASTTDVSYCRSVHRRQMARYLESLASPKGETE
jgi:hypothetical protein